MKTREKTISRKQLTAILVGVSLAGFTFAMALSFITPSSPEPKLNAQVVFSVRQWQPQTGQEGEVRLMPCITVTNPTNEEWGYVSIAINKMFYFNTGTSLAPGASIVHPCQFFVTKGGNVPFRPGYQTVERVTVFAQIPTGERAVFETSIEGPASSNP